MLCSSSFYINVLPRFMDRPTEIKCTCGGNHGLTVVVVLYSFNFGGWFFCEIIYVLWYGVIIAQILIFCKYLPLSIS